MRIIVVILCLVGAINTYAQKEDNIWLLGDFPFNKITFNDTSYTVDTIQNQIDEHHRFARTNASICDASGNLLMYFTGQLLLDANGEIIDNDTIRFNEGHVANLTAFNAYGAWNSAMVIPIGNSYSLFSCWGDTIMINNVIESWSVEIRESSIVKTTDEYVIEHKEKVMLTDTFMNNGLAACRHANGEDWWVVSNEGLSGCVDLFYCSADTTYLYNKHCEMAFKDSLGSGQIVFNEQGTSIAIGHGQYGVQLLDFDRCTGSFSNLRVLYKDSGIMAAPNDLNNRFEGFLAFSPSGRFLYVERVSWLYQFDMEATDIMASGQLIHNVPGPPATYWLQTMQLAPNGKIYIGSGHPDMNWNVIHHPDSLGMACAFEGGVALPYDLGNAQGLPNFPNYRLGKWVGSPCDTTDTVDVIHNALIAEKLQLYPNPSSEVVRIEYGNFHQTTQDQLSLSIVNLLGEVEYHQKLPAFSLYQDISIHQLATGTYFVHLYNQNKFVGTRKLQVE